MNNDKKFKVLCGIGAVWAILFLVMLKIRTPLLEGVEVFIICAGLAWLAYWTISFIRTKPQPPTESKTNGTTTETKN